MCVQRFGAYVAAGPRGCGVIAVPFDPDEVWGAKAEHPVGGTIDGSQVGGIIAPGGRGWALTLTPMWLRDEAVTAGDDVTIELGPEGPQRADLADDISAALEANPRAAAFVAMGKLSRTPRSAACWADVLTGTTVLPLCYHSGHGGAEEALDLDAPRP